MSHKAENDAIVREINDIKIGSATVLCACGEEIIVEDFYEGEHFNCDGCGALYHIIFNEPDLVLEQPGTPKEG